MDSLDVPQVHVGGCGGGEIDDGSRCETPLCADVQDVLVYREGREGEKMFEEGGEGMESVEVGVEGGEGVGEVGGSVGSGKGMGGGSGEG